MKFTKGSTSVSPHIHFTYIILALPMGTGHFFWSAFSCEPKVGTHSAHHFI